MTTSINSLIGDVSHFNPNIVVIKRVKLVGNISNERNDTNDVVNDEKVKLQVPLKLTYHLKLTGTYQKDYSQLIYENNEDEIEEKLFEKYQVWTSKSLSLLREIRHRQQHFVKSIEDGVESLKKVFHEQLQEKLDNGEQLRKTYSIEHDIEWFKKLEYENVIDQFYFEETLPKEDTVETR